MNYVSSGLDESSALLINDSYDFYSINALNLIAHIRNSKIIMMFTYTSLIVATACASVVKISWNETDRLPTDNNEVKPIAT